MGKLHDPTAATTEGTFLTPQGKLPPFAQRRLDDLLARNATPPGLPADEALELRQMLDFIDRANVKLLRREVARRRWAEGVTRLRESWHRLRVAGRPSADDFDRVERQIQQLTDPPPHALPTP